MQMQVSAKMEVCFCNRLHNIDKPTSIAAYAFSGSLCYVRQFETLDGSRYCLTIFSLSDYKHLHFPHDEYKLVVSKLYALQCTQTIFPALAANSDVTVKQERAFIDDFKISFGEHSLKVGPVTGYGLVKTAPFRIADVFSLDESPFTCNPQWDICICKRCPVFKRLFEFETTVIAKFHRRKSENVILSTK